jgi:hypothetical protein
MRKNRDILFNVEFLLDYSKGIEKSFFSDFPEQSIIRLIEGLLIGMLEIKSPVTTEINFKLKKFNKFFINQDTVEIIDKHFKFTI